MHIIEHLFHDYLCYIKWNHNLFVRLQLHDAIYRHDSFEMKLRHCANLKAMRYVSTGLNRIVADKSHGVILA